MRSWEVLEGPVRSWSSPVCGSLRVGYVAGALSDARPVFFRSLQVHQETGVPHSRLLEEQRGQEGGGGLGGPLRFPHTCIFWLRSDSEGERDAVATRGPRPGPRSPAGGEGLRVCLGVCVCVCVCVCEYSRWYPRHWMKFMGQWGGSL